MISQYCAGETEQDRESDAGSEIGRPLGNHNFNFRHQMFCKTVLFISVDMFLER